MNLQLMEVVLPRLAQRLHRDIQRYRSGELNDAEFSKKFESRLRRQYAWLAKQGVSEDDAALTIHGAVLVLSGPGLRAEAKELGVPLEVVEQRAIRAAAADLSQNCDMDEGRTIRQMANIMARYAD